MALAVDVVSSIALQSNANPWTWSHTVSGANRILVVAVSSYTNLPTGVTYNGVAMTNVAGASIDGGSQCSSLWYLIAPDTGAHNVVVNFSGGQYGRAAAISFTGAAQTGQPDAAAEADSSHDATSSLAITTVAADCYIIDAIALASSPTALARDSGQTDLYTEPDGSVVDVGGSYKAAGAAGAKTMVWTWSYVAAAGYTHAAIAIKPASVSDLVPNVNDTVSLAEVVTLEIVVPPWIVSVTEDVVLEEFVNITQVLNVHAGPFKGVIIVTPP